MGIQRREKTVDSLAEYLRSWINDPRNAEAVQLDGSSASINNPSFMVVFKVDDRPGSYALPGDCKRSAICRFLARYDAGYRGSNLLNEVNGYEGLNIGGETKPDGWYCYQYAKPTQAELLDFAKALTRKSQRKKKAA